MSFYFVALLSFIMYWVATLFIFKSRTRNFIWCDIAIWIAPIIAWVGGFYLSDAYGIGFGKTLGNISELFFIGILTFAYVAVRILYIEFLKSRYDTIFIKYLFVGIVLSSLLIGLFYPGIPE